MQFFRLSECRSHGFPGNIAGETVLVNADTQRMLAPETRQEAPIASSAAPPPVEPPRIVIGEDGWRGTAYPAPSEERDGFVIDRLLVRPDDGGAPVIVPAEMVIARPDGTHYLPLTRDAAGLYSLAADANAANAANGANGTNGDGPIVIPLVREEMTVGRRVVDTGRGFRVTKSVRETTEVIEEPLMREHVAVERVPMNRILTAPVEAREEGDTLIIPVMEEVLVLERRLVLKEEIHIQRTRLTVREPQSVTLRHEEAHIERLEPSEDRPEKRVSRPA
jgi:uncharacterized protein (TIGR02271 family)